MKINFTFFFLLFKMYYQRLQNYICGLCLWLLLRLFWTVLFQAKRTSIKIRECSLGVAIIFICLSLALPSLYHYHSLHVYLPD